jgi:isoleucyl-tRNA synthetase
LDNHTMDTPIKLGSVRPPNDGVFENLGQKSGHSYILAKARLPQLFPIMNNKKKWKPEMAAELYEIKETMTGRDLVGKRYKPLFDFFANTPEAANYWQVVSDTYVTDDAGTGVVHQAPAFGEDDYRVCLANGIIVKGGEIPVQLMIAECLKIS